MSKRGHPPRGNLNARSNSSSSKTLTRGFGIVRKLTNSSERDVYDALDRARLYNDALRRKPPVHMTVIGFIGMTKREQASLQAGFNVARLEERLQRGVEQESPRVPMVVKLGSAVLLGNLIYCEIDDDRIKDEQIKLAGQVALNGISPQRIDKKTVPPHAAIGFAQVSPAEETRQRVEEVLFGQTVLLQRWNVYPDRYA